jgi:hypothetical protein
VPFLLQGESLFTDDGSAEAILETELAKTETRVSMYDESISSEAMNISLGGNI